MAAKKRAKWKKLPPITGSTSGCLNCGSQLPMTAHIAVGFGSASLTKDGEHIFDEGPGMDFEDTMTVAEAERKACRDPDHDWQIDLQGPLSGRTYQRHGKKLWVLVAKNEGFA